VVNEIGPTLRFATATVTRAARSSANETEDASA
jgi:hypothetical protein